jgi:cholesterol transport system auxiliary component
MKPPFVAAALAFSVTACGPLVQIGGNDKPPASLLTLTATAVPPPASSLTNRADTIGVELPGVPATLQTLRLPVTVSPTEVRYLVGASWAEQPNRQFQRLLADTITAGGIAVIDIRQSSVSPQRRLTGSLLSFGLDVSDPAAPQVRVRFDAQIANPHAPDSVMLRRFEATEPAFDQRPVAVAAALNRAANRVAGDVSAWAAQPPAARPTRP